MIYESKPCQIKALKIVSVASTVNANGKYPMVLDDGSNFEAVHAMFGQHQPAPGDFMIFGDSNNTYLCPAAVAAVFNKKYQPSAEQP